MADTASRANRPAKGPLGGFPDGQGAGGRASAPEPSLNDVVYIVVVRSVEPRNGQEVPPILSALREAGVQPVTDPVVAWKAIRDSGSRDHCALVQLGFDWDLANTIFTVVSDTASPIPTEGPSND